MDETLRLWGANIRTRREALGLSPDALAEHLDVSRATVSRWENGLIEPHRDNKRRLAEVLDTHPFDLFPFEPA